MTYMHPLKVLNSGLTSVYRKSNFKNTASTPVNFSKRAECGLSLIELMIAMAIGMVILLVISVLFMRVSSGFRTSDDTARAVESGNFGLRTLGEDLRMAGFVGLFNDPPRVEYAATDLISSASSDNCGDALWPLKTAQSIEHVEFSKISAQLPCIPSGSYISNNPAIVIRRANGTVASNLEVATDNLFIQSSQNGAIIFRGNQYAATVESAGRILQTCQYKAVACPATPDPVCGCTTHGATTYAGVLVPGPRYQYLAHIYYIRPCSRPSGTTCTAADDGGEPIPTLVRRQLSTDVPAVFVETPIAEGVERMSFSYGIDNTGDGVPDEYTSSPVDINSAITVRMSLLMRSRKSEAKANYDDTEITYTLADNTTFNCVTAGTSCKYHRYLLTDTIQLKNYATRK